MPERFLGYGRQAIDEDDVAAVVETLRGDWLTQGPAVERFEQALAERTGAAHAVCVANGTAALHIALAALDTGPGHVVVTSANTFVASATCAVQCGASPEFVDVEGSAWNLDLDELEARCEAGPVHAVVAVHYAGRPLDMERLLALAARFGFRVVEDASHALGASYAADGRSWRVGEHAGVAATALSFHPVKHVTSGEGGAVLCHDAELAARLRRLRHCGIDTTGARRGRMEELGWNYRLSDLHAALGASQLVKLERFLARRHELAARYSAALAEVPGIDLPEATPGHAWHLYVVHVDADRRDALAAELRERGIGTQVHYRPVPHEPFFRARTPERAYPVAEEHAARCLSLPLFPALEDDEQDAVIAALRDCLGAGA